MVFRSKIDVYFLMIILISIILFGVLLFFPLFIEKYRQLPIVIILASTFMIATSYFLWTYLSVKYVLNQSYLFVKCGIKKRKIPYNEMIKVLPTTAILTGFTALMSRDAIELFYEGKSLKSVKISPKDKSEFISELKKRSPRLQVK